MCDVSPDCDAPPIDCTATNQKKFLHLVLCYSHATAHCHPFVNHERDRGRRTRQSLERISSHFLVFKGYTIFLRNKEM